MAVTFCEYHGKTGVDIICTHLAGKFGDAGASSGVIRATCAVKDDEGEVIFTLSLFYCAACAMTFGFSPSDAEISEQAFNSMEEAGPFNAICYKCFREAFKVSRDTA
ncbi:MAG: hypothetical protein AB7Q37_11275 [Pyrinomonadaceae bacterium]